MVTFFRKLAELQKSQPSKLETFFSTHPNPAERAANVSREIGLLPRLGDLITNTGEFQGRQAETRQPAQTSSIQALALVFLAARRFTVRKVKLGSVATGRFQCRGFRVRLPSQ